MSDIYTNDIEGAAYFERHRSMDEDLPDNDYVYPDVTCSYCGWGGNKSEVETETDASGEELELCPECGEILE